MDTTNPENKAEAERLLGVAEKLLTNKDLNGAKEFAILAQETEPLLEGSDQILAIIDVLLSAEKRVNNHNDWYAILQLDHRENRELEVIKKQYRKLALLLHPDKNKYPFADQAFKLVADAWAVFSDSDKKTLYDKEFTLFTKVDLGAGKLPVRRGRPPKEHKTPASSAAASERLSTFWTACPYCYHLYEYPRVYEGCCLRCDTCKRAFQAVVVPSMPPRVPGKDAYYCCWGVFPMGFTMESGAGKKAGEKANSGFPHWMPPVFGSAEGNGVVDAEADGALPPGFPGHQQRQEGNSVGGNGAGRTVIDVDVGDGSAAREVRQVRPTPATGPKKRGRPRKYS